MGDLIVRWRRCCVSERNGRAIFTCGGLPASGRHYRLWHRALHERSAETASAADQSASTAPVRSL